MLRNATIGLVVAHHQHQVGATAADAYGVWDLAERRRPAPLATLRGYLSALGSTALRPSAVTVRISALVSVTTTVCSNWADGVSVSLGKARPSLWLRPAIEAWHSARRR